MAGWNLQRGVITDYNPDEEKLWSLFNYVFSDACSKRNTYKFGFIKSLLDNAFNGMENSEGIFFSYSQIFARFAENYWNLVVKYDLRQMRSDGKSVYSNVEKILKEAVDNSVCAFLEFSSLDVIKQSSVISRVASECRKYVVGALYNDFDGVIYSFDLKHDGLVLNYRVYEFMLKYKSELERLNYYSWAKFLESVNEDNAVVHLLNKLEFATPRRSDLSIYREILRMEFEENTCFYCGRKLGNKIHVDHFIPWSFVKDDKLWNFVLACPACNERKNNRLPNREFLAVIEDRNKQIIRKTNNRIVLNEFSGYSDDLLIKMWNYAKMSGVKEYSLKT
ncbi:HNH endonuclease domain-containing protein [Succinimonas amylolytica]|uniref:HNH endonuclease domain-containing protein n=1 Tax=Succinimonas amylolytica TaxID=83769 RepID=UPI000365AFEA|nr:HNH endonuclease domain-containing protein [Succinimonas amylolytica]